MTDLSITATQVLPGTGAIEKKTAGGTITAGQPVYLNAAGAAVAAQADEATTDGVFGIALNGASSGQPVSIQRTGTITIGLAASVAAGEVYVLSAAAAGGIAPYGDLISDDYVSIIGVGNEDDGIDLAIYNSGVQVA